MVRVDFLGMQSRGYCGIMCSLMAMNWYGIKSNERELTGLMIPSRLVGVEAPQMIPGFYHKGLTGSCYKDGISNEELKRLTAKYPVLVDWFAPFADDHAEGHWCIAHVKNNGKRIDLYDPKLVDIRDMGMDDFARLWFDYADDFPDLANFYCRRALVVKPGRPLKGFIGYHDLTRR